MLEQDRAFLFKKGRLSQRISKVAVRNYSLKNKKVVLKYFTNFLKIIRCEVFLLGKIKKLYTTTDVFLKIFSNFSEQPFFRVTASEERKKIQKQLSGYVF